MPSQPVGEMLEVTLLRLLVAGLIGVDQYGVPNFSFPFRSAAPPSSGGIGGTTGITDNAITTASGTGGNTLQGTVATVAPTTGTFAFNTDTGVLQFGTSKDVVLVRDAANALALRNGANAQTFNIYNTFTDGGNYARVEFLWVGTDIYLLAQNQGTGSAANIIIQPSVGKVVQINTGLVLNGTPTADPHVAGKVWSNLGILTISSG